MAGTRRTEAALDTLFADNSAGDISAQDGRDVITSVHPAKTCQSDTQANEPAASQLAGDLFLPNNGFQIERYSGSAWQPWGPLFPFTKPVSGDFAWVNQGSAAISTTNGGVALTSASNGSAHNWRIRKKAVPSAPYTITAAFLLAADPGGFGYAGIGWRQSSDGKLVTAHIQSWTAAGFHSYVQLAKWTSVSAISAFYDDNEALPAYGSVVWYRIADDNTDRKFSVSADGQNWVELHTVGRTDFLTADEVFFAINPYSAAMAMTLLSWKEA